MRYARQHNIYNDISSTAIYKIRDDGTWEMYDTTVCKWCTGGNLGFNWSDKKDSWLCGGEKDFYNYEITEDEAFLEMI